MFFVTIIITINVTYLYCKHKKMNIRIQNVIRNPAEAPSSQVPPQIKSMETQESFELKEGGVIYPMHSRFQVKPTIPDATRY